MKRTILSLALIIFVVVSTTDAQRRSPRPSKSKPPRTALDAEAEKQTRNYWLANMTKCGESYFMHEQASALYQYIHELRGISFKMYPKTISEADRLNGIQWRGTGAVIAKAWREINIRGSYWGEWVGSHSFEALVEKKNGAWKVYIIPYRLINKISCEEAKR